jgi:hypothetical protein
MAPILPKTGPPEKPVGLHYTRSAPHRHCIDSLSVAQRGRKTLFAGPVEKVGLTPNRRLDPRDSRGVRFRPRLNVYNALGVSLCPSGNCQAPPIFWCLRWLEPSRPVNESESRREQTGIDRPSHSDAGPVFSRNEGGAWQPTSACGAPLWMKMVVARADLSEPTQRRSREADITAVACDPDWQSGPAAIEAPFFVAPGNGSTHSSVSNVPAASRSPSNGRRR